MRKPVFRKDEIVALCTGRSVLHLGFIQHDVWREKRAQGDWLHDRLLAAAAHVVGVDYLASEVEAIRAEVGCACVVGDVMALDRVGLDERFDVVVCGELIEHVENPGLLLAGIQRFCHAATKVIITTPNPWCEARLRLIDEGRLEPEWLNPEHVAWYSPQTLAQLLVRCGYAVERADFYYAESAPPLPAVSAPRREWKRARRYVRFLRTKPQHQDGLFFVATPVPTASPSPRGAS